MWEEVKGLLALAALNSKVAEDALDDAVNELALCREKLEEAIKQAEEVGDIITNDRHT